MTSRIDSLKTDEFLRRRKLRLQQVREQSKDIAKKIRQRAKVEKLRHIDNIDAKKEKEYFDCQEKLVKHLELLYRKGLNNVGTSHKNALEVSQQEDSLQKIDLSKLRGREAVAELRKKKQEKLDEQKKLLDRKLQAREAANEISREKSTTVVKNVKPTLEECETLIPTSETHKQKERNLNQDLKQDDINIAKNDMGTQWESAELLNEWEPRVPELLLPKDDSVKDSGNENVEKIDKSKKLNLFALSDEMPTSLRGGLSGVINEEAPLKPSLTVVSEYLQNRSLRLRQNEPISSKKADNLQSIKETIQRSRATKTHGNVFDNVCHVLDEQVIPVPSWQAQDNSGLCSHLGQHNCYFNQVKKNFLRAPNNNLFIPPRSLKRQSSPVLKEVNHIWRTKFLCGTCKQTVSRDKSSQSTELSTGPTRKKSISVYNHNTRNIQNICSDERLVSRDNKTEEDAYAQALKETTVQNTLDREQPSKEQNEMRTRVAVTKQNVEKEYRDTLAFLNTLSRDKNDKSGKLIKTAYMDEHQQQMQNERHQKKLQEEFKTIEKECYKRNCKYSKRKPIIFEKDRNKSNSPVQNQATGKEFEYSWMPVPDGDSSFAVHTIPNTKHKSGNTVKFSKHDNYHEYRSRHKHTPPTKDVNDDGPTKRYMEAVFVQQTSDESDDNRSSLTSETSSVENLSHKKYNNKTKEDSLLKDADRIIIYKILESKKDKRKKENKTAKRIKATISNDSVTNDRNKVNEAAENKTQEPEKAVKPTDAIKRGVSFEQLQEGVYQAVTDKGDNVTSLYFTEDPKEGDERNQREKLNKIEPCCKDLQIDGGDNTRTLKEASSCKCGSKCRKDENSNIAQPSAATSTTSFTTAFNDKLNNGLNEDGYLHLIDRTQELSKLYVGASGFLKDDKYEVVIQLRKKDIEKDNLCIKQPSSTIPTKSLETETRETEKDMPSNDFSAAKGNIASSPMKIPSNIEVDSMIYNKLQTPNDQQTLIEIKSVERKQNSQLDIMCEKDTHTSFQDSYAIPVHVPKLDPISKPATSTYTQTSFNSSIPRPPFLHMSSSTSTAYMSPPELILPKFLKHNYVMTNEEIFQSENTMNQLNSNFIAMNDENCKEFSECMCSACVRYHLKTPPNTACSCDKDKSDVEYNGTKKTKCKCHKCRSRSETNIRHKLHTKKCRSMLKTRSSRDLSSDKRHPTTKKIIKNKDENTCGTKLNPTVKNYVHRLLALNREGLKAVEVINQDCSAITTPGSSIINLSCNVNKNISNVQKKISLEQVKNVLKQKILNEDLIVKKRTNVENKESQTEKYQKHLLKLPKNKSVHKVKSLNISKHIFTKKKPYNLCIPTQLRNKLSTSYSTSKEDNKLAHNNKKQMQTSKSKSSTTPRIHDNSESKNTASSDFADVTDTEACNASGKNTKRIINELVKSPIHTKPQRNKNFNIPLHKATRTSFSSDSDVTGTLLRNLRTHTLPPIHISTQTNDIIDAEIKFMKIAEDKLQNMEKIANLTEKCTERLSNLAKVLEEVRRNKSLVYSQISTSDSTPESESKADKNEVFIEISNERMSDPKILTENKEISSKLTTLIMPEKLDDNYADPIGSAEFTTFLKDIPKPVTLKTPLHTPLNLIDGYNQSTNTIIGTENIKSRGKPPPALSRIHLKHGQDIYIVPHELSTVIEVESPMSTKLKGLSSRQDSKLDIIERSDHNANEKHNELTLGQENPDLLTSKNLSRRLSKVSSTDSSDDSKMRMMDLKKFNDIMLKPFITLQDYAKQCNIGLDEGSNLEDANKEEPINDDLSSLHSDGSLPDVIAELLKRKIISEPFKFDTGSNVNSTTFSSESTISILALSKGRKEKKKSGMFLKNKENVADTSESLSISSNPDLENAFQKLGMGWASSTLKKTKERLALSSSSNTSSSSMTQFKIKNFSPNIPNFASDSASTLLDTQNKRDRKKSSRYIETSRNAVQQQTSLTNSMTVKEFLTNELAKKITFNNKSSRREAEEEFISLYETKIPEEMKHTSKGGEEDQSSATSVNNNRARTSTPVQIFKSQAYHSSSTSNTSNGFFSNADDLSSVKVTSTSIRNHSTSDKDDLTIPNYSLKIKKSDCSKSE